MHQRPETIQPKSKTSPMNSHPSNSWRQQSLRRRYSHHPTALATDTVDMVVATLQLINPMNVLNEEVFDQNSEQDQVDDSDIERLDIGQHVEAHIPDMVLTNLNVLIDRKGHIAVPNSYKYDNTTLLFLDVSGFTSLTEQYSNAAHLGIDQLTRTLNSYFEKLVFEILINGGDIYKFAGDAILALWIDEKVGPQQALKCALNLQKKCGAYETDVGVTLHLKVALAFGPVCALFVGSDEFKHYLLTGNCVKDVNVCEQLCEPGDILLTKAVYERLKTVPFDCKFEPVSEDIDPKREHIAMKYSTSSISPEENTYTNEQIYHSTAINDRMDISNQEIINACSNEESSENGLSDDELSLKIDSLKKSFLLRCVHQRIERKQSLDYLSELRRVTISFINLDISNEKTINNNLHENINKIFIQIYNLTKMMGGVLTKALLFDKGFSFLCVFGLPGYKQGDDTANALKSAQMIHSTIRNQCQFVDQCSIGVTTGLTYCGVVGHPVRCEYTVIGRKVNMAARLMCAYPNMISCDQETNYNSRLNSRFFQKLPNRTLKGMSNVGVIWQYGDVADFTQIVEQARTPTMQLNEIKQEDYPLLGRRVELMIVAAQITLLDEPTSSKNRRRDLAAIIFEGEDKIGRTRLLNFIAHSLEYPTPTANSQSHSFGIDLHTPGDTIPNSNHSSFSMYNSAAESKSLLNAIPNDIPANKKLPIQVINYRCQFEQRFNEFSLLRSLLRQLLQFHDDKSQYECEQYILRLFDSNKPIDVHSKRNLFLLNDLLDVRFRHTHIEAESGKENSLTKTFEVNLNELLLHILNKLIDPTVTSVESSTSNIASSPKSRSTVPMSTSGSFSSSTAIASKIIFIIDDIHFADESSLKHLLTLGSHSKCLLILSMRPPRNNQNDGSISNILQLISTDSRVYLRRLPGLELRYLATLACQILCVHRVPAKIVRIFNESCNGIPGFCEQILLDLLRKEKIYIVDYDERESYSDDSNLIEGDSDKLLSKSQVKCGLFTTFFSRRKQSITFEQRLNERAFARICLLSNLDENDLNADFQQNFQNYIMCRIDRLSEGESLLVKIAAIVGNTFSRMFLWHLVDPQSRELININSCILEMMQRTIIECAFSKQQTIKTRSIKCYCLQNPAGFPSQCRLMAFAHATIREGIYNSLTDTLKRLLTRNAIDYLEKQCKVECLTCGTSKSDSPFLVDEEDGLAKIIRKSQQHAFADIVKIAALKEIDNAIKTIVDSNDIPARSHSKRSSFVQSDICTPPQENGPIIEPKSTNKLHKANRIRIDSGIVQPLPSVTTPLPSPEEIGSNDEKVNCVNMIQSQHRDSNDPNITLISVYSPTLPSNMQINVRRTSLSSTRSKPSQFFSLFRVPKQRGITKSSSNTELVQAADGVLPNDNNNNNSNGNNHYTTSNNTTDTKTTVDLVKPKVRGKRNSCFASFFQHIFCQCVSLTSTATVTPAIINEPNTSNNNNNNTEELKSISSVNLSPQIDSHSKENGVITKAADRWKKVRKAVLPDSGKSNRAMPNDDQLLQRPMFSIELMQQSGESIACLDKQSHSIRTFRNLYDQSFIFNSFQSFVQRTSLIQYVFDQKQNEEQIPDLNKFLNEYNSYSDLRICECIDFFMSVYVKLIEYHTNLYDMAEKSVEDKRNALRSKHFERIIYYRTEVCQLLLSSNCLQRLLVEIGHGRRFLERFRKDVNDDDDFTYEYQCLITKYTFDLFQAIVLKRTRALSESKQICDRNLKQLNQAYKNRIWEMLFASSDGSSQSSAKEKRKQYERSKIFQSKESLTDLNSGSQSSTTNATHPHHGHVKRPHKNTDPLMIFTRKYSLEYLLCEYNLLRYDLSHNQSVDSIETLMDLQYYMFPLSFSIPCTITLVEYFNCQKEYSLCVSIINKIIQFWWSYVGPREKLEFAKLKTLSLVIEFRQGLLDSAITSGYFAKRILTGYHEHVFLIHSYIHLTLSLIGEMRVSNVELILQHLEYLSEQTMNCYAKLWYYTLGIDIAIELGYELLPLTDELLDNVTKYRKKLSPGPDERSLVLVYCDSTLAQIYARLGLLDMSKIHFHQALHQIKYDHMHLNNIDFRFKRALLKLVEVQLLHWFHTKENDEDTKEEDFLLQYLNDLKTEEFISWNKSRFYIYQAYYDRLINDYRREKSLPVHNDYNWEKCFQEAERNTIKLDREWIKCLRSAWSRPFHEQLSLLENPLMYMEQHRGSKSFIKQNNRYCIRPSLSSSKISPKHDTKSKTDPDEQSVIDNYFRQKFIDSRSISAKHNASHFQLYVLPVRV